MKLRVVERVAAGYVYIKVVNNESLNAVGNFYRFNSNIVHRHPVCYFSGLTRCDLDDVGRSLIERLQSGVRLKTCIREI